jgi:hypothetical protein
MRCWWKRSSPEPERHEVHPAVPVVSEWDEHGIIGTIGSGPSAGSTVVAHPYWTPTGALDMYELELWDGPDEVRDAAGRLVISDLVTDDRVPGEEGGLIDALTREVDVTWWTDRERIDAFWAVHWDPPNGPRR